MSGALGLAALALGAAAAAAGPPQAWLDWKRERQAEIGARLSPASLALIARVEEGVPLAFESLSSDRWIARPSSAPASGKALGTLTLVGSTVTIRGSRPLRLRSGGEAVDGELGLGFTGWERGPGRFTVLVHDLRRPRPKGRKLVSTFPYDPAFAPRAKIAVSAGREIAAFETSDGRRKEYERAGWLEFALAGKPQKLSVWREVGEKDARVLFLLFKDKTNGKTTYKAGRYLYLKIDRPWETQTSVALDFNFAFTPYCHYSSAYSCPLATERLSVPVSAGERVPRP